LVVVAGSLEYSDSGINIGGLWFAVIWKSTFRGVVHALTTSTILIHTRLHMLTISVKSEVFKIKLLKLILAAAFKNLPV